MMRFLLLTRLLVAAILLAIATAPALAQTTVAVSYDPLLHELTENSSLGVHGEIARFFGGSIAAVGDIGVNHFDQATVMTVAPGARYVFASGAAKIQPAAQVVAGLWSCQACEVNEFFVQPGVTVDYAWTPSVKLRFQLDVRRIFFDFGTDTAERVGIGVVWNLR